MQVWSSKHLSVERGERGERTVTQNHRVVGQSATILLAILPDRCGSLRIDSNQGCLAPATQGVAYHGLALETYAGHALATTNLEHDEAQAAIGGDRRLGRVLPRLESRGIRYTRDTGRHVESG